MAHTEDDGEKNDSEQKRRIGVIVRWLHWEEVRDVLGSAELPFPNNSLNTRVKEKFGGRKEVLKSEDVSLLMCMWWDKCTRLETVWFLQQAYSEQQHKWNSQQSRGEREKEEGRGEESMSRMEGGRRAGRHAYSMWQRERERGEEERRERYHQQQQQCSTKTKRTGKVWRERARERERKEKMRFEEDWALCRRHDHGLISELDVILTILVCCCHCCCCCHTLEHSR